MYFKIGPRIFDNFPELAVGIVVGYGLRNTQKDKKIEQLLHAYQAPIASLTKVSLAKHPHIVPWRNVCKQCEKKSQKPVLQHVIEQALSEKIAFSGNGLNDISTATTLKYFLPITGKDLDQIDGDITLTYAKEHENHEIVYRDGVGILDSQCQSQESQRAQITSAAKNSIFIIPLLPPIKHFALETVVHELAWLIEQYCGGTTTIVLLDRNKPQQAIAKNGIYLPLEEKKEYYPLLFAFDSAQTVYNTEPEADSQEYLIRIKKAGKVAIEEEEPWPEFRPIDSLCKTVLDQFSSQQTKTYTLAGRIRTIRKHGKVIFADIQDRSGKLQLYIRLNTVGDKAFNNFMSYIDIGDIIWCKGEPFRTKMGEITLAISEFSLLSKCLRPLPEKFHGIADVEIKYRQRYLDLIFNKESRTRFEKRSHIINTMRAFFTKHDFMEVETPMLHPIPGGAVAQPFITHHNALHMDLYLRVAPELYLKRLVIGGFERVYEINRSFRNEGISTKHNPEFTLAECYAAHEDYHFAMDFVESMLRHIVNIVCNRLRIRYDVHVLDFSSPFKRVTMQEAVARYLNCSPHDLVENTLDKYIKQYNIMLTTHHNFRGERLWGEKLNALFEHLVEPTLIQPTFITEFPISISPLARRNKENPALADRYELFIAGMELSNGFNELNDPFDQSVRFLKQAQLHATGSEEVHYYDADYIKALEYGLPPTAGIGIGIDRLTMILTNTTSIKDVILFPTLKMKQ